MRPTQHATRMAALMILAAGLLGWLARHTEILFADGLRYVAQAKLIDQGTWREGLVRSVDHPIYPMAIAAVHQVVGGTSPDDWQFAAQLASILAGVLLVIPLYLVSAELFGDETAWLACILAFLVPITGHVFADALSESTFLLFWSWGFWAGLRFLRQGKFGWLPLSVAFGGLAYLCRPEGLLLPAALACTLLLMPLTQSTRMYWPRWWAAIAFLILGPALVAGPFVLARGGLATKPAVGRLLGLTAKSGTLAVERERPLEPDQSVAKTYALAFRSVARAIRDAVSLPLLPLVAFGLWIAWPPRERSRLWLFVMVVEGAAFLGLMRLHATGGYCTPRHAMLAVLPMFGAAALGLSTLIRAIVIPGRWFGQPETTFRPGPIIWAMAFAAIVTMQTDGLLAPVNDRFGSYKDAGGWVSAHVPEGAKIVDVTGWSQFYSGRPGYTFADLHDARPSGSARWIVVRDAHLKGPWIYCDWLREMVAGRTPVASFPPEPVRGVAQVYIFDRETPPAQAAAVGAAPERR
ncbi:glycosyltransferase family 39 protein [Isosphaeraceae bacterium EP7]